jgi:hypothetical protein
MKSERWWSIELTASRRVFFILHPSAFILSSGGFVSHIAVSGTLRNTWEHPGTVGNMKSERRWSIELTAPRRVFFILHPSAFILSSGGFVSHFSCPPGHFGTKAVRSGHFSRRQPAVGCRRI